MEALANSENENYGWECWTQGATKDEREWVIRPCPTNSSSSGSAGASYNGVGQTNPSNRNAITCPYGATNCTPIPC